MAGKNALFSRFVTTLTTFNVPLADALKQIDDLPVDDAMRALPRCMDEWTYWTAAAREIAALNSTDRDPPTKEEVGDVYAKHCMTHDPLATPRYNLAIALMQFATHQTKHAFGRAEGLPYPHPDGSRTYSDPRSALQEAMGDLSDLSRRVDELWPHFIEDTAERVGFDLTSV